MELWSAEHAKTLPLTVVVMIAIAAILRILIGKKDIKIRLIPLKVVACLLVALEIGKQVLSFQDGYDLYHLPFHFCSQFIFMMPIAAFYKGKHENTLRCITAALCTATTLLTLVYPCLIYSAGNISNFFTGFFDFHTVAFHNLVIFGCILFLTLELHEPDTKKDQKNVLLFIAGFCVISASMAHLLQTNFNNFYTCNIPPLEEVRVAIQGVLGYGITQILYVLIVSVLDVSVVFGSYWLYRLLRWLITKKKVAA